MATQTDHSASAAPAAPADLYKGFEAWDIPAIARKVATRPRGYYPVITREGGRGRSDEPTQLTGKWASALYYAQQEVKHQLDRGRIEGECAGKHYVYTVGKFAPFVVTYWAVLANGDHVEATPAVEAARPSDYELSVFRAWERAQAGAAELAADARGNR
jgi:hypothetical protein